ncbi:hypothetical protein GL181_20455 [Vibrio toranzoniae]|nr:hypothetical protein [Vibrio toranzoniae]
MKKTCSHCTFLIDVSGLIPESSLPDGISLRCGKEERFIAGWPAAITNSEIESCEEFIGFDSERYHWEWDDAKNHRNVQKHRISFEDAVEALEADDRSIRLVSKSWESLDSLDYEGLGIPRTMANTDPVRDTYLFEKDRNVWVLVSTLRGESGLTTQRVISVRRARPNEQSIYKRGLG